MRRPVKILWTKNNLPLSHLICAVTKEPVSHVALCQNGKVLHATITGVVLLPEAEFRKKNQVVFELTDWVEASWFTTQITKWRGSPYDVGAILFLGLSLLLRRVFKLPLPKSNLWQSSGMFLCTEWATLVVDGKTNPLITPYGLYLQVLKRINSRLK